MSGAITLTGSNQVGRLAAADTSSTPALRRLSSSNPFYSFDGIDDPKAYQAYCARLDTLPLR
jgi:hypothetical protein